MFLLLVAAALAAPPDWVEAPALQADPQALLAAAAERTGDAPLEILYEDVRFTFGADRTVTRSGHLVYLLRDPSEAPYWTRVDASWSPWFQARPEIAARVIRPDGEVVTNDEQHLTPRGRFREFRLEARTPVSDAPHVSVGYVPARFVFLAEGKQPWALAVGHLHARTAVWPIETALATMRASLGDNWEPPLAELGAPEQRAGEEAYREPPPETPWKKYVLWAVLLVGALTIAGFALTLLREAPDNTQASGESQS